MIPRGQGLERVRAEAAILGHGLELLGDLGSVGVGRVRNAVAGISLVFTSPRVQMLETRKCLRVLKKINQFIVCGSEKKSSSGRCLIVLYIAFIACPLSLRMHRHRS